MKNEKLKNTFKLFKNFQVKCYEIFYEIKT